MGRSLLFGTDEWYHCYNRGVDKRKIFLTKSDYHRFRALLYLANSSSPVRMDNLDRNEQGRTLLMSAFETERGETLVDVGAYALMPNHFHVVLREKTEGGITTFMRKLGTGYTMYFNKKNERTGPLLGGKFRAKHISDDRYIRRVITYIHANAAELIEPRWKEGVCKNKRRMRTFLESYEYSSLPTYLGKSDDPILNMELIRELFEQVPSLTDIFEEAVIFARNPEDSANGWLG